MGLLVFVYHSAQPLANLTTPLPASIAHCHDSYPTNHPPDDLCLPIITTRLNSVACGWCFAILARRFAAAIGRWITLPAWLAGRQLATICCAKLFAAASRWVAIVPCFTYSSWCLTASERSAAPCSRVAILPRLAHGQLLASDRYCAATARCGVTLLAWFTDS